VQEARSIAEFVSGQLPPALTLEYERVLCPLLLDAHNRYAGAEYVSGLEPRPALHQKGLIERRQCAYVADAVRGALERLLVDGDRAAALSYCEAACSRLLMGEVSSHLLVEGGFVKRADQTDLCRMAGLAVPEKKGSAKKLSAAEQKNQAAEDETLRKENAISLAIELLQRSATADGRATRSFRLGEFVPFCAVRRQGGGGGKQFENVASPEEVVQRGTPVDLRLLCERRLLPALIGQVRESSGKATKEADLADKPALLGRILSHKERQDMRFGKHTRASSPGVLTTPDGWRLYGLAAPPPEPASQKRGGQSLLGFTRSAAAGDGGGGGGGGSGGDCKQTM